MASSTGGPNRREAAADGGPVEFHSIDYIPEGQRRGRAWNQTTLWFMADAELATLAIGLIGIAAGLNLLWAIVAAIIGLGFGTLFQATHSVQGPKLGIPQMIQSRAQFGYYGAIWPQLMAWLEFVGFTVFNVIVGGQALHISTGLNYRLSLVVVFAFAAAFAVLGYHYIHLLARWATWAYLVVFGFLTIGVLFVVHLPAGALTAGGFKWAPFLLMFGVTASYQVTGAPFVSDYSRYLPKGTSPRKCFGWTYLGCWVGAFWPIALGSFLSAAYPKGQTIDVVRLGGNAIFGGFGKFALLIAVLGMVGAASVTIYSGSVTGISIADSLRKIRPGRVVRLVSIAFVTAVSVVLALLVPQNFLTDFSNFLLLMLYFLIPWTAVNLVDYFLIRHGDYSIPDIFNPKGIYGRLDWKGATAYVVGVLVMIPFFSTSLYTGPVANSLKGADITVLVGLPVAAVLYYVLAKGADRSQERQVAHARNAEMERVLTLHATEQAADAP
jgi:NCS1 nucleoside transporter family